MNTIDATFHFGREVMMEAHREHRAVRRWPRLMKIGAYVAAAWGAWLLVGEGRHLAGGIWLGAGLLALLLPLVSRAGWLRAIEDNPLYGQDVHCQFSTEGFMMAAEGRGVRVLWDQIHKIVEGDTGYLIYPKRGAFFYIPASGFATEIDADRVKGLFLSEKMRRN